MELKDRVALITGGGSGIGAATARLFAAHGARVAIVGRTQSKLDRVAEPLRAKGHDILSVSVDISDSRAMEALYRQIDEAWGRLDLVFAHAGVNGLWAPIDEISPEDWHHTVEINLTGTFNTVRYAVPYLKRNGGAILITSSVNGTRMFSNSGASAYAASKAGQVAFMKMIALELAKYRIRVNAICPGAIDTEIDQNTEQRNVEVAREPVDFPEGQIPLTDGTPGRPEDVAELALFLLSDRSRHISGTEVWIDGAQSLLQG